MITSRRQLRGSALGGSQDVKWELDVINQALPLAIALWNLKDEKS